MSHFFRSKGYLVFALLFVLSSVPFFINPSDKVQGRVVQNEQFNHKLLYLNTIDKTGSYIDSVYSTNNAQKFDTALYVQTVSAVVKERFYRDLSNYNVSENWIAFVLGKFIWPHMSAIVNPDDILKYPHGLCSQQTIVFMELLKQKHINVRSIGLGYTEGPGHFLCEVHYNNSWRLHDVTFEPKWIKAANIHESMSYYIANKDSLYLVYETRIPKDVFDKITEKVAYGKLNEFPAKKMLLFHNVTWILTYLIPLSFLSLSIVLYRKKKS